MFVYMLSTYDEHGAEEAQATLDRSKLSAMIEDKWPPAGNFVGDNRAEWISEARASLSKLLELPDDVLAKNNGKGHGLHEGWGGMQLHVVELT